LKTATNDDYQRLIDLGQSMLKGTDEHWSEIPSERFPVARFGQGLDGLFVAVGHLMLGNLDQSRAWFRRSAEYLLEADRQSGTVIAERRALECALFCGDREFRIQVAQKILPREGRVKPMEHSYTMFLKYMILNDLTEASAFVDEALWLSRATMKKRGGYGTLQGACKAFACRQPAEFSTALEALLQEHKMKTAHGRTNLPDGIICFPGAALLILAREQGLPVSVTSPFIPAALLD